MALNHWVGMGRVTAPIELNSTPAGVSVARFTIAVDRDYKGANGEKLTDFINVVVWRQKAEFVSKYFDKGSLICIEGSIETRSYEKDGVKRYITEVNAEKAYFTGEKRATAENAGFDTTSGFTAFTDDKDLPF